jgi:hypothetical protein
MAALTKIAETIKPGLSRATTVRLKPKLQGDRHIDVGAGALSRNRIELSEVSPEFLGKLK